MALEHDHVTPVDSLGQVEGLSSISERVVRKKKRQRQNRRSRHDDNGDKSSEDSQEETSDSDGHIDFCA